MRLGQKGLQPLTRNSFFIDFQWFIKGFRGFDKAKKESLNLRKWIFMNGRREPMKKIDFYGEEGKQMKVSFEWEKGKMMALQQYFG